MTQAANGKRRSVNWPAILMAVAVAAVVIGGSIGLVRFRNRDRGATQAVYWAVDHLAAVPDTVVKQTISLSSYHAALSEFRSALTDGRVPVDSIRNFYHEYALWSRDGVIDADEVVDCLPYLGLSYNLPSHRVPVEPDTSVSSVRDTL